MCSSLRHFSHWTAARRCFSSISALPRCWCFFKLNPISWCHTCILYINLNHPAIQHHSRTHPPPLAHTEKNLPTTWFFFRMRKCACNQIPSPYMDHIKKTYTSLQIRPCLPSPPTLGPLPEGIDFSDLVLQPLISSSCERKSLKLHGRFDSSPQKHVGKGSSINLRPDFFCTWYVLVYDEGSREAGMNEPSAFLRS